MNKIIHFSFICFLSLAFTNTSFSQDITICLWEDVNGDGLDNDGAPLGGPDILLDATGANPDVNAVDQGNGCWEFTGLVDGETYCIDNLDPGTYGMSAFTFDTGDSEATPGTSPISGGNCFTWATGDEETISLGLFIFSEICSNVFMDCTGDGVSNGDYTNVTIQILDDTGAAATDIDGNTIADISGGGDYCFSDLPPGDYIIGFTNSDGSFFPIDNGNSDIDVSTEQTSVLTLNSGIMLTGFSDAGYVQGGCIGGIFFHDFDGDGFYDPSVDGGLDGGSINISTAGGGPVTDLNGNPVGPINVDAGTTDYEFCDLPPGDYIINFIQPTDFFFWPANDDITVMGNSDAPSEANGSVMVSLNPCDNNMIDYVDAGAYELVLIGGQAWIDENDNITLDGEASIAGLLINLYSCDDCGGNNVLSQTVSDNVGYGFLVPPGEYCIQIDPSMFAQGGPLSALFAVCDPAGSDPNSNVPGDANNSEEGDITMGGTSQISCIEITCPEDTADPALNFSFDFCFRTQECDSGMSFPPQLTTDCDVIENDPDNFVICDLNILNAFCGTMFAEETMNGPNPLCSQGGSPHNITWFGFVAGEGDFDIEMIPIGCQPGNGGQLGMQAGIYTDCSFTEEIWCQSFPCSTTPLNTANTNIDWIPGQTYYFFFDGCAGSVCDFEINVVCNSASCDPFALPEPTDWELGGCIDEFDFPPLTGCVGGTYDVIVNGYEDFSLQFDWIVTTPTGDQITLQSDEGLLNYQFLLPGVYNLAATVNNGCSIQSFDQDFTMIQLEDVDFGILNICEGDAEFPPPVTVDVEGTEVTITWNGGPVIAALVDPNDPFLTAEGMTNCGCTFDQLLEVNLIPNGDPQMDQIVLCEEDYPFEYDGSNLADGPFANTQTINGPGLSQSIMFPFSQGVDGMCDVLVNVDVITPEVAGEFVNEGCIAGANVFSFDPENISVTGDVPFEATYIWMDDNGNNIEITDQPTVNVTQDLNIDEVCLEIIITIEGADGVDVDCTFDMGCVETQFDGPEVPQLIDAPFNDPVCANGTSITYCLDNYIESNTYEITLNDGGTITSELNNMGCFDVDWTGANPLNAGFEIEVTDGCGLMEGDFVSVTLTETPEIDFSFTEGCAGEVITFTYNGDPSDVSWVWDWDFGDGVIMTGDGPDEEGPHGVVFPNGGTVTVSLNVEAAPGCSSTLMQMVDVPLPLPAPVVSCVSTGTDFVEFGWADNPDIVNYDYVLMPSGTTGSTMDNTLMVPAALGETITITLIGFDANGCSTIETVHPCVALDCDLPTATIDMPTDYCERDAAIPFNILFSTPNTATGTESFMVDGTPVAGNMFDPNVFTPGMHTLSYQFTEDGSGCPIFASLAIQIFETPDFSGTATNSTVCVAAEVEVFFSDIPDQTTWDLGDATLIGGVGVGPYTLTYASPGPKTITATAFNQLNPNCVSDPITLNFVVEPAIGDPMFSCGMTTQNSVEFTWIEDANASYSIVDVTGIGTGTQTGGNYTVTGLSQGDMVEVQLLVSSTNTCPGSGPFNLICVAEACPDIVVDITESDGFVVCPSADPFGFTADVTVDGSPSSGGTLTWSGTLPTLDPGTGMVSPSAITSAGTFTVIATYDDGNACTASAMIQVEVIDPTATISASQTTICETQTLSLSADPQGPNAVYDWDLGGGTGTPTTDGSAFDVSFNGMSGMVNISLTVIVDGCESETDVVAVQVDRDIELPAIQCQSVGMDFITFGWEPITGATAYEVSIDGAPALNQNSTEFTATGLVEGQEVMITVTALTDSSCGSKTTSFSCVSAACPIITLAPSIMGTTENSFCTADTPNVTLDAGLSVSGGTGAGTITWTLPDGSTMTGSQITLNVADLGAGDVTVDINYDESGCTNSGSLSFSIFDSPQLSLDVLDPTCFLDNLGGITANVNSSTPGFTLSINGEPATTDTDFQDLTPGLYEIVLTDDNLCTTSMSASVTSAEQPTIGISGLNSIVLGTGQDFTLNTSAQNITNIIWTDGATGTVLAEGPDVDLFRVEDVRENGTICVDVIFGTDNCSISECLVYEVRIVKQVEFTNILDLNSSSNNSWSVYTNCDELQLVDVNVFDRYGNLVYTAPDGGLTVGSGRTDLWDGKFGSSDVVPGVYIYQAVVLSDGITEQRVGDITIIR